MRHLSDRFWQDRPSVGRGQVEPLAALAAVFAVCAALTLYAGVLDTAMLTDQNRETATLAADRAVDRTSTVGIVDPTTLDRAMAAAPEGRHLNITVTSRGQRWQHGPIPPATAANATRRVSVRHGPGTIRPGRVRVVMWS